jgi:hypothetical protein
MTQNPIKTAARGRNLQLGMEHANANVNNHSNLKNRIYNHIWTFFTFEKMHFTSNENSCESIPGKALQMLMCIRRHRVQSLTTHTKACAHTLFLSPLLLLISRRHQKQKFPSQKQNSVWGGDFDHLCCMVHMDGESSLLRSVFSRRALPFQLFYPPPPASPPPLI